jgi:hypothetical protein
MIGNGCYDSTRLDETCFYGKELLYWLSWITDWAEGSIDRSKAEEMRDKRQLPFTFHDNADE